jgi:thymidylate synthase ThyX
MTISAKIIADSVSPLGKRITTFELHYPRIILPEVLTHRALSRNTESSRAIPVKKRIEAIRTEPFYPTHWGANQPGMQARSELTGMALADAQRIWGEIIEFVARKTEELNATGLHKQIANRWLETGIYIDQVVTATELSNFFKLRAHPDAQPEFKVLAETMLETLRSSTPTLIGWDDDTRPSDWHLPYITLEEKQDLGLSAGEALSCSVARCARVSTLNHDGTAPVKSKDLDLAKTLENSGHWSPFEHQAFPLRSSTQASGNFKGWFQYRQSFAFQNATNFPKIGGM